jgi:hypothetical protein
VGVGISVETQDKENTPLKKLFLAALIAITSMVGFGASMAKADPTASLCHNIHVNVNGTDVVNDAACNTAP